MALSHTEIVNRLLSFRSLNVLFYVGLSLLCGCGTQSSVNNVAKDPKQATGKTEVAVGNIAITPVVIDAPTWKFRDLHGNEHDPFEAETTKAIVVVFVTTDCPIANYYQPTLSRMTEEYRSQGVQFFLCHSDPDTKLEAAIEHASDFKTQAHVILDSDQAIATRLGAKVTPEAFLINSDGDTLYRGRINDLYADYGKRRSAPRTNDLTDAIDAHLADKPIETAKTTAIGCYIPYPKKATE